MSYSVLFCDAGHGLNPQHGTDNGAQGIGTTERDQVVSICRALTPLLQQIPLTVIPVGVETRMSLPDKIAFINQQCATHGWGSTDAVLLSVHLNAGPSLAHGVEAWYGSRKPAEVSFARVMAQAVAKSSGLPLRNPPVNPSSANRLGGLGILDQTVPTAVLVECGFITSPTDVPVIEQHQSIAQGLYAGLMEYLQIPPASMQTFADVPTDAWYSQAVNFLLQEGIVTMPPDGLYRPSDPINRAEMAELLARLLHKLKP